MSRNVWDVEMEMGFPLANIRVLDLTHILAGPYCTLILADLGAEVIKIERPGIGDTARTVPPFFFENQSAYFIAMNRNKKSISLDLKCEKGRILFYKLVGQSDIVVENRRPGNMKKLKIDYKTLKNINPRIIYCSISGFGQTGPDRDHAAFDLVIQARGGVMSFNGEPGRIPVRMGVPMGDLTGGLFAVQGILAALYQREITRLGQYIDISMLDCQTSLLTYRAQYYFTNKEIAEAIGSRHRSIHPIDTFKTKTFDIVVDANTEKVWREFCQLIGHPEMCENKKFNSRKNRYENKDELYSILKKVFLEKTGEEWLLIFGKRVPIAPINKIDNALNDLQTLSRNMVPEVNYGNGRKLKIVGNPIKMSAIQEETFKRPPYLGEHTREVLASILEFSDKDINDLEKENII